MYDGGGPAYWMSVSSIIDSMKRVVRCGKWRMLDRVDSLEQEETIQDTRN